MDHRNLFRGLLDVSSPIKILGCGADHKCDAELLGALCDNSGAVGRREIDHDICTRFELGLQNDVRLGFGFDVAHFLLANIISEVPSQAWEEELGKYLALEGMSSILDRLHELDVWVSAGQSKKAPSHPAPCTIDRKLGLSHPCLEFSCFPLAHAEVSRYRAVHLRRRI